MTDIAVFVQVTAVGLPSSLFVIPTVGLASIDNVLESVPVHPLLFVTTKS